MGLFYAYIKDANSDLYSRYLITFVSREAADEWWRMISNPSTRYAGHVKRLSPQFFTQDMSYDVLTFFSDNELPDARQFLEKMFFTLISSRDSGLNPITIQSTGITDHISGQWYFIRSKADPWSHWYFRTDGTCLVCGDADCDAIHVSSEYRTKFCVQTRGSAGDSQLSPDFVMIGKDEVSITAPLNHILHVTEATNLKATKGYQGESDLLFSDLKNRFITRAEKQTNGEIWEYVVPAGRGLGETWELAD